MLGGQAEAVRMSVQHSIRCFWDGCAVLRYGGSRRVFAGCKYRARWCGVCCVWAHGVGTVRASVPCVAWRAALGGAALGCDLGLSWVLFQ